MYGGSKNKNLQKGIDKYGLNNFEFCILEFITLEGTKKEQKEKLNALEQLYQDELLKLPSELVYNIARKAGSTMGVVPSLETRKKIGLTKAGDKNPNYGKVSTNALPVNAYDTQEKKFLNYQSRIELKKNLGIDYATISSLIESGRQYKGRYIIYTTPNQDWSKISLTTKIKQFSMEGNKNVTVKVYDLETETFQFCTC